VLIRLQSFFFKEFLEPVEKEIFRQKTRRRSHAHRQRTKWSRAD